MRKTMRGFTATLFLTLGLALLSLPAAATSGEAALGSDGEVYIIRTGTYGELFPGKEAYNGKTAVLALDVVRPDAPVERFLVPGTETDSVESRPSLIFEEVTSTVFVVWESRINYHPTLTLASLKGTEWSDPIVIVGNPFEDKTAPDIAITHDSHQEPEQPGTPATTHHRTIIHVIWSGENGVGQRDAFYTPVIFEDGAFLGLQAVSNLNEMIAPAVSSLSAAGPISAELLESPRVQSGRDGNTVVAAFASATHKRLFSVEIDVLPLQLSRLADDARAYIIDLGARSKAPGQDIRKLTDDARAYIIDLGVRRGFQSEVARSFGDLVRDHISKNVASVSDKDGLKRAADGARAYIIDLGAKLSGRGLRNAMSTAAALSQTEEYRPIGEGEETSDSVHMVQFRFAQSFPMPTVESGRPIEMFLSESGQGLIVSWIEGDRLRFLQSQQEGWSDVREIRISSSLNLSQAYQILLKKVGGQ